MIHDIANFEVIESFLIQCGEVAELAEGNGLLRLNG